MKTILHTKVLSDEICTCSGVKNRYWLDLIETTTYITDLRYKDSWGSPRL